MKLQECNDEGRKKGEGGTEKVWLIKVKLETKERDEVR